jgi:hypothetical protein
VAQHWHDGDRNGDSEAENRFRIIRIHTYVVGVVAVEPGVRNPLAVVVGRRGSPIRGEALQLAGDDHGHDSTDSEGVESTVREKVNTACSGCEFCFLG